MLKILIADDHPVAKEGLKHILSQSCNKVTTHDAANRHELLEKIEKHDYDLVFLELNILGHVALSTIEKIRKKKEKLPLLILTLLPEELFAVRTLRSGASGYLSKSNSLEELLLAVERVLAGKKYISHSLAEKIANNFSEEGTTSPQEKLTNREYEIMQMIACGEDMKKISHELSLSPRTVSIYRKRILKKMNLKNNAAISIYAIKKGLIRNHEISGMNKN